MPSDNTSSAKIRVTATDLVENEVSDISDATFTIDSTSPIVTVTAPNGSEYLKGGASTTITWTATDTNIDYNSIKIEYWNGSAWVTIATGEANDGSYTWTPIPSLDIATAKVRVTASDLAGNSASDESDAAFTIDSTNPTVTNIKLTTASDGSGTDLTPSGMAIKGTYYVSAYVSDNLAGINWAVPPTITVTDSASNPLATGTVTADSTNGRFFVDITVAAGSANGTANISVSGVTDKSGNVLSTPATDTFNINKSELALTIDLEGVYVTVIRPIKIVLGGSLTTPGVKLTIDQPVNFNTAITGGRRGTVTITNLSNAGQWTSISAKDEQHTLLQTIDLTGDNKQFVADFTGLTWPTGNGLFGGDATNDNLIDILDYGLLAGQYGSGGHPKTPPARDADFSCNGTVGSEDFVFIQIGFLRAGDALTGFALAAAGATQTVGRTSITVKELADIIGMREAQKADVNNDRIVDTTDMALFLQKMHKVNK